MEQVLDGSSKGFSSAKIPADRAQANQGVGKVPKLIPASLWDTLARKFGKALPRMARKETRARDLAPHSKTQQSVHWWFSHQWPGSSVKQGATTIHEDSAAYTLSTSSLQCRWKQSPMAIAGLPQDTTVRPHVPSSSQIHWVCCQKWKVKWDAQTVDMDALPGNAAVKGNDWEGGPLGKWFASQKIFFQNLTGEISGQV